MQEIYLINIKKNILDTASKAILDTLKTASKTVVHKAAEATGEFIGNKLANKIAKCWKNNYSTWKKRGTSKGINRVFYKNGTP